MSDPAGLHLLLEALRAEARGAKLPADRLEPAAVEAALAIAARNKILSRVAGAFSGANHDQHFADQKLAVFGSNSIVIRETIRLCALLRREEIGFAVVKGPFQQNAIYGDYFVRGALDIDLLVGRKDFLRTRAVLQADGYHLLSRSVWWWAFLGEQHLARTGPSGTAVDLHWSLHQPGTPVSREAGRFITEARHLRHNGIDVPILSERHTALLTVVSMAKAIYNREPAGAYLLDLFAMLKAGSPEAVGSFADYARTAGLGGHAAIALRGLGDTFDIDISQSANTLPGTSRDELLGLIFTPEAPGLRMVRRRTLVWEFCDRNIWLYALELGRMGAAQIALKMFERQPAM